MSYNRHFKNVLDIGNLSLMYVILKYEFDILFICEDCKKRMYLCIDSQIGNKAEWIVFESSKSNIIEMLERKITVRDAFLKCKGRKSNIIEMLERKITVRDAFLKCKGRKLRIGTTGTKEIELENLNIEKELPKNGVKLIEREFFKSIVNDVKLKIED